MAKATETQEIQHRKVVINKWNTLVTGVDTIFGPSETVPDETMTLQTIFRRYASGQNLTGKKEIYTEEEDIEFSKGRNIKKLDLAEIEEMFDNNKEEIERLKKLQEKQENPKGDNSLD